MDKISSALFRQKYLLLEFWKQFKKGDQNELADNKD